jgi:hypothetical protein
MYATWDHLNLVLGLFKMFQPFQKSSMLMNLEPEVGSIEGFSGHFCV